MENDPAPKERKNPERERQENELKRGKPRSQAPSAETGATCAPSSSSPASTLELQQ
jgi:hypothetical protein